LKKNPLYKNFCITKKYYVAKTVNLYANTLTLEEPQQKEGKSTMNVQAERDTKADLTLEEPQQKEGKSSMDVQAERDTKSALNLDEKKNLLSKWDEEFCSLRHRPEVKKLADHCEKMANLADNFLAAASIFTQMIIAEQHVTEQEKTIRPLDVGGVAGGTKYSVHGLFFKYPVDENGVYVLFQLTPFQIPVASTSFN
jgi:septal ring factor EnvC (AmiA/AmiB activator)